MDRPKPLYTFENVEEEWKKLTEALNTNDFNFSDYLEEKRVIEERNCCSPLRKKDVTCHWEEKYYKLLKALQNVIDYDIPKLEEERDFWQRGYSELTQRLWRNNIKHWELK